MNFKDKPHYVIQVTYTLVRQRIGGICVFILRFNSLHGISNKASC